MKTRDIERLLKQAREGAAACAANLAKFGPHLNIERALAHWNREVARLTEAAARNHPPKRRSP